MRRLNLLLVAAAAAAALPSPVLAWDLVGHQAVAHIAWSRMRPQTRARAVALLKAAPPDAGLASLLPVDNRPLAVRERSLFARAAFWPDIVRDEAFPERRARYHRGPWHYVDRFWEQPDPARPARERTDLPQGPENHVERLAVFSAVIGDETRPAAERAVALAWVLHLAGDVHQPLHNASRVTATEPQGDRGGNLFSLGGEDDLHWFWDSILSRSRSSHYRRHSWQSEDNFVAQVAARVAERHPREEFDDALLAHRDFQRWTDEGFAILTRDVYPSALRRNRAPSASYQRMAERIAERAIALAGYRLAALLDDVLGSGE